jgi:monofunctional biosynthetic peptidoglycan transglycosylase
MARRVTRPPPRLGRLILLGALALVLGFLVIELYSLPSTSDLERLRSSAVSDTAIIRARVREAAQRGRPLKVRQRWVELDQVARPAITAILTSEDSRFFSHGAVDLKEIDEAVHGTLDEGKPLRGASTITQQVAKNLYLSGDRSFLRKAKEAYLAWRLERVLSKRRILRLYLNIAEWGDGVFGIEAASSLYLKKPAAELTLGEGAALAAMLPNPHRFSPAQPLVLRRHAAHVLERVLEDHLATDEEVAQANLALDKWLGPGDGGRKPVDDEQ